MKTRTVGAVIAWKKFEDAMALMEVDVAGASKVSFEPADNGGVKVTFKVKR